MLKEILSSILGIFAPFRFSLILISRHIKRIIMPCLEVLGRVRFVLRTVSLLMVMWHRLPNLKKTSNKLMIDHRWPIGLMSRVSAREKRIGTFSEILRWKWLSERTSLSGFGRC